jgi:type I restriction enzyme S subunit
MLPINKVVESVSITHKFNRPVLKFLNTSDVENGKIININHLPIEELKGQAKKTIQKHDILFSEIRPKNRRFAYVDIDDTYDFVVSTKLMVLRNINSEVDNKYFYYFLTNDHMLSILQDRAENRIGSFPQITFDLLSEYFIRVPHLSEQKKIASNLSSLDSKIELNNRINIELESMAKTLYDYWFVQFDFPDKNGKPYKTSGGNMVWNEELKREIPEGWEVKKVKEFASTGSGSTPIKSKKEYYLDGNVPWINSGEVNNPFIVEAKKYITQLGLNSASTKLFKRGTLLIAMYGATAGKVSILDIEACTNQAICSINVHNNSHRNYLKFVLDDLYEYLINLSTGSARDNLSQDKIKELIVLMPDDLSIQKFDKLIEPTYDKILNAYRENQKLTELRDWLLPMLMNGQVKVSEL